MAMSPKLLRPRATGFVPTQIAGLQAWYDFADATTLGPTTTGVGAVSNNGPVRFAKDKSSAAANLTCIHPDSSVPSFVSSALNGKSALSFDGGDVLNAATGSIMTAPFSLFIVCKANATGSTRVCGVTSERSIGPFAATNTQWGFFSAGGIRSFGVSATENSVLAMTCTSGRAVVLYGNNSQSSTGTANAVTVLNFAVGNSELGSSGTFNGLVYECLSYNVVLTASQLSTVSRYLGKKWGITVS